MKSIMNIALLSLLSLALVSHSAFGQGGDLNNYYGQTPVPMDGKTKAPRQEIPDPFGSPLFIDGQTDVALDARSIAAQQLQDKVEAKSKQREIDRSIRADIASGQPVTVLIAPEHFVQLTFLKDGEIVYPRRAFAGQPDLLIIDKKDNSPYVYIAATAMVAGQTTNLFVETEEDGKIQTYVINLLVTEPQNIREQVSVNLIDDRTPPIKGGPGSTGQWEKEMGFGPVGGPGSIQTGGSSNSKGAMKAVGAAVSEKFSPEDTKRYLNTMIEMASKYQEAKEVERKTGRAIYRDVDIKVYPAGKYNYVDPIEGTNWNVHQVWFFPKYDAILLDVRVNNTSSGTSMWDFSQVRWQANKSPTNFASTAASPLSMQTLPGRTNQIWYLIQGNRLDPGAEFSPVFPRAERRGTGRMPAALSQGHPGK